MLYSKLHRATVTEANLHYVGSITIDQNLLDAANMRVGQKIDIVDGHLQLESNPGNLIAIEGVLKGGRKLTGNILVSGDQLDFTDMFNQWKKQYIQKTTLDIMP